MQLPSLTLTPIGLIRTPFTERADAPRQATAAADVEGRIELAPGLGLEDALADLDGWDRIWVLFWFDRNSGWKPKVLPPRSDEKRGLFSTRSPYRPNPIGMSAVELLGVSGLEVRVRGVDMLDATPVLDIKPYVPYADAFPEARAGWLTNDPGARWDVDWAEPARAQRAWLEARGVDLGARVDEILATSPRPHAYRRIRADGAGFRLAWKDFRVRFRVDGRRVLVERVASGYRPAQLAGDPALELHRAFVAAFG